MSLFFALMSVTTTGARVDAPPFPPSSQASRSPGDKACTAATVVLCTGLGMSLFFTPMSNVNIDYTVILPPPDHRLQGVQAGRPGMHSSNSGFKACQPGDKACTAATVVLCTGLGMSLFFALMSATTTGARVDGGARDTWHSGWWPPKLLLWVALLGMTVFLPLELNYPEVATSLCPHSLRLSRPYAIVLSLPHAVLLCLRVLLMRHMLVAVIAGACFLAVVAARACLHVSVFLPALLPPSSPPPLFPNALRHVLAAVVTRACYMAIAAAATLIYLFFIPSSPLPSLSPPTLAPHPNPSLPLPQHVYHSGTCRQQC
ncbi:unnamed protein product [Closterium sp. Naga37s-1]|nr:unnamed protein product [Closterium sp. Naga37s-1]